MHKVILFSAFWACFSSLFGQKSSDLNELRPAGDGLWFMFFDTSGSKSTILEFVDFVVALEAPIRDAGGGATWLADHSEGAEKMLRTLRHQFPTKPLRYLFHSHWHPHSISSVAPFWAAGATIVTTRTNFEKLTFVDPASRKQHEKQLIFVENDRFELADAANRIVAHRFLGADFSACPTDEYLYFELPKYEAMHVGCMFSRFGQKVMGGREMQTGRCVDLQKLVDQRHLDPQKFIRLTVEKGRPDEFQAAAELREIVEKGVTMTDIWKKHIDFPLETWQNEQPQRLGGLVADNIPASILNQVVYQLLQQKKLEAAVFFAQQQALLDPTDANVWDTLGEAFYFLGDLKMAAFYESKAIEVDPKFKRGGPAVWQKNLAAHQKVWAEKP